jgi:hypothetical protein
MHLNTRDAYLGDCIQDFVALHSDTEARSVA